MRCEINHSTDEFGRIRSQTQNPFAQTKIQGKKAPIPCIPGQKINIVASSIKREQTKRFGMPSGVAVRSLAY